VYVQKTLCIFGAIVIKAQICGNNLNTSKHLYNNKPVALVGYIKKPTRQK